MGTIIASPPLIRRSGNYKPSLRDNNFVQSLTSDYTGERFNERVDKLKEEVVEMFINVIEPLDQLELIDALQRLGIGYHFDEEIKRSLDKIYKDYMTNDTWERNDLHATALQFRLLRQHGYNISQDVFKSFMKNGRYKECLYEDVKGLLSLYESYFYSFDGESLTEVAWSFSSKSLKQHLDDNSINDPNLIIKVRHALKLPLNWRMPRLEARWYIDMYGRSDNIIPALLELAKLNFNIVQGIYQEELKIVSTWWNNLGLAKTLFFARDRLVESYIWAVGKVYRPQGGYTRMQLAKAVQLVSVIDDIYDVYGTIDELELFTDAIERWDINYSIERLPNYMKSCFLVLYNFVNEMVYDIFKEQSYNALPHLKKGWVDLSKGYMEEARWYHSKYKPTLEQYFSNGVNSIGIYPLVIQHHICSTYPIKREALEYLENMPDYLRIGSVLGRIIDDGGTSQDELARGDTPKAIQCYMSDTGASEEAAHAYMGDLLRKKWREFNLSRAQEMPLSRAFTETLVNLLGATHYTYHNGDGYSVQDGTVSRELVNSIIVHPIPM